MKGSKPKMMKAKIGRNKSAIKKAETGDKPKKGRGQVERRLLNREM